MAINEPNTPSQEIEPRGGAVVGVQYPPRRSNRVRRKATAPWRIGRNRTQLIGAPRRPNSSPPPTLPDAEPSAPDSALPQSALPHSDCHNQDTSKIVIEPQPVHLECKQEANSGFDQRASLGVTRWMLTIFGGVYVLRFIAVIILLLSKDATFEKGAAIVASLLELPQALVTLAVGYYFGDRKRH